MSLPIDISSLHASKRKRTTHLLIADYPVNPPIPPPVSFFGHSALPVSPGRPAEEAPAPAAGAATPPRTRAATLCSDCPAPQAAADDGKSLDSAGYSWSFLAHPVLAHLPKWPALTAASSGASGAQLLQLPTPLRKEVSDIVPAASPLQLYELLNTPPIAASLAANLYGHDILNLCLLNTSFFSLLSHQISPSSKRSYFHALLLKSLLCPRVSTATEPRGATCAPAGGNVGPCMLCATTICSTCVSPEIWTTHRYRYICPPCCSTPTDTCTCQRTLWLCRPCYRPRWLADLTYNANGWFDRGRGTMTCFLCAGTRTQKTDSRVPAGWDNEFRFREWISGARTEVRARGKGKRVLVVGEQARRPVGCAWCRKRIDPKREEWGLRPDMIRRGEERGQRWMEELERRKQEREAEGGEA